MDKWHYSAKICNYNSCTKNNRINYIVPADYTENSDIDKVVKEIIESVKHADNLKKLNRMQKQNLS